ncbi:alpha/beta fold hydrolase [Candidatus Bipolaricaulota bacterium]
MTVCFLLVAHGQSSDSLKASGEVGRERFYYIDEEYITYEVIGDGPIPVVVLHGFGASSQVWHDVLGLMDTSKSTFYLFDLKGCGQSTSPHDERYSTSDQALLIGDFIAANGLEGVTVIGHSMGGGIAMIMAVYDLSSQDSRLEKLVLLNPAAYEDAVPFFVRYLRTPILGYFLVHWYTPRSLARRTLERLYASPGAVTERAVDLYANEWSENDYRYVLRQTAKQVVPVDFASITERYQEISLPVFIAWGEQDPVLGFEIVERLRADLPNAHVSFIEECGHSPHEERPIETAKLIQAWLDL